MGSSKNKKVVIIGGVAGGASCAARLRRHEEQTEIVMFEKGPFVSFANCGLPYYIGEVIKNEEDLFLADPTLFRERFNIDTRVNHEVKSIDAKAKTVRVCNLETNEIFEETYDELVLSPGSSPLRPPLPGIELPGIFTIRSVPDRNLVKEWIANNEVDRAVVIGGGFIGLEMAENLAHLGIQVSLIERGAQIMPALDQEMTSPVVEELEKNGVGVVLGDSVASFEKNEQGLKVLTSSGRKFLTDLVILSIGVRPDSNLAIDAGLELASSGHIVVDDFMRTSDASIYAVGDAVQIKNNVTNKPCILPLAGPANRQGRIAADNIAGMERPFGGVQGTAVCGLFNLALASTGLTEKQAIEHGYDYSAIYAHPNNHVGYYPGATAINMKMVFDNTNGKVLGAQAVGQQGAERRIDVIAMAIQMGSTVFDLEESELCYAPQFGAAKDPVNILGMIGSNIMRGDLKVTPWSEIGEINSIVLDVRSYSEIAISPITNMGEVVHIPLNELRSRLSELDENIDIHVSCAVGARANTAVRLLMNSGLNASLLPGGTLTLNCLNYCRDSANSASASNIMNKDQLLELHTAKSPLSSLPIWLLRELKEEGVLREYTLGEGESITLKTLGASDIIILASGEVDVFESDEVSRHLSAAEKKRRPVKLTSNESKIFFARTQSTMFRIGLDHLDFYDSWFAMIENLSSERAELKDVLSELRQPSVFMDLPLTNVHEALKRMEVVNKVSGDEIIAQGDKPDYFYIILNGAAEVWQTDMFGENNQHIATLQTGNHFGEDAFVMDGTRTATIKISGDTKLLALHGDDFKKYIAQPLENQIDHKTAKIQVDEGVKHFLDVRYEEEWFDERIPGAELIPLPELRSRINELDKDKQYIIYCHAGKRSAVADVILKGHGIKSIWMTDGIRDWPYNIVSDM